MTDDVWCVITVNSLLLTIPALECAPSSVKLRLLADQLDLLKPKTIKNSSKNIGPGRFVCSQTVGLLLKLLTLPKLMRHVTLWNWWWTMGEFGLQKAHEANSSNRHVFGSWTDSVLMSVNFIWTRQQNCRSDGLQCYPLQRLRVKFKGARTH